VGRPREADLVVRGSRIVTPEGERPAQIWIRGDTIHAVTAPGSTPTGAHVLDVTDRVVLPGLVDAHVHINEPGRTEWEGFDSATRAAAAGGVTTLVDMPLNCIPATTTVAALEAKHAAARGRLFVDCAFWGGVVPGNTGELAGLVAAGVAGFKAFLVPSGVEEFQHVDEHDLRQALPVLAASGRPLLVHAELAAPVLLPPSDPREYAAYLASRPASFEIDAIQLLIRLCRDTGAAIHVVHLSSAEALPALAEARRAGLPLTVETCPHYLFFAAEDVPAGRTEFKCSPPIRERANRERLWEGLDRGTIDMVVSDHSPCTPALKGLEDGDFLKAWGGIASLELRLPVMWTEARRRGFTLAQLATWTCERPAALAGLGRRKGRITAGYDADLVVIDPDAAFTVEAETLRHRHPLTPYRGHRLTGRVEQTILRGALVYDRGALPSAPRGEALTVASA
jgi:allantoinase